MIPVTVLTGFLGSGKTTLLAALLAHPALARTAVIINEAGEIGLDHDLVAASDESFIELSTGCLCCVSRGDLAATLTELLTKRACAEIVAFERVVIETSGLADPAPILQLLMTDTGLASALTLAGVVTTVDAVTGLASLDREPQSMKQAALADRIVITKTDLTGGVPAALAARLEALNPAAQRCAAVNGHIDADFVVGGNAYDLSARIADVVRWLAEPPEADTHAVRVAAAADAITTYTIVREAPLHAITLTLLLETLAEHCGADLLRLKGIMNIVESPDGPAVIHGVQHVFHPPAFLSAWPSADRRSRMVVIARGVPTGFVQALIDALEAEVAEVA